MNEDPGRAGKHLAGVGSREDLKHFTALCPRAVAGLGRHITVVHGVSVHMDEIDSSRHTIQVVLTFTYSSFVLAWTLPLKACQILVDWIQDRVKSGGRLWFQRSVRRFFF